jgi:hypothetical protein
MIRRIPRALPRFSCAERQRPTRLLDNLMRSRVGAPSITASPSPSVPAWRRATLYTTGASERRRPTNSQAAANIDSAGISHSSLSHRLRVSAQLASRLV